MTRLVLHAGTEFADGGAVHRDLVSWREPLREAGVLIPPSDSPAEWRETGLGLLRRKRSASAAGLLSQAAELGADLVLVSSDALSDALTSPDEVAALAETASAAGLDVRVVVVVREQIGYINSLYCRRVLSLDTARSFAEVATTSVPAHRFDFVAAFGTLADADGVDLVAVGYPDLVSKGAGRAVLEAAGLGVEAIARLPQVDSSPDPVPGPILVGAVRLLHKRLRRGAMFNEHGKARLRQVVDELATHAVREGWDTSEFWGWDPALRRRAEGEFLPSNEIFAQFVWGGPWRERWSAGKTNRADLATLKPAILLDVFDTVDKLLKDLAKRPVASGPAAELADPMLDDDDVG